MERHKRLKNLEATEQYLFHGSPDEIGELEPRQPYIFDKKQNKMVPDGEPAVVASPYSDVAIFRAIVNKKNIPEKHWSGFGYDGENKKLKFRMSRSTADTAKEAKGYVHVLNRNEFTPKSPERPGGMEWRADKSVKPVEIVEVTADYLPEDISIEPDPSENQ